MFPESGGFAPFPLEELDFREPLGPLICEAAHWPGQKRPFQGQTRSQACVRSFSTEALLRMNRLPKRFVMGSLPQWTFMKRFMIRAMPGAQVLVVLLLALE